jgi:hypothetical protein
LRCKYVAIRANRGTAASKSSTISPGDVLGRWHVAGVLNVSVTEPEDVETDLAQLDLLVA